ncbi:MAG TPA: AMP-binding protein [Flavobacterium sp.]|jgi:2-aminobenzoate-CoA ligase
MFRYEDNFAHDSLPSQDLQPDYIFPTGFESPEDINCVYDLLDRHILEGRGNSIAMQTFEKSWTYLDLYEKANQIAHVLKDELELKSGNRVLIRSANNPMFVACWFAIIKAGGIVVATMPLLREKELSTFIECAEISHALCDYRLEEELALVKSPFLRHVITFDGLEEHISKLDVLLHNKPKTFKNFESKAESLCLIGFTSGTTGKPKMTSHYHRDVLLICKAFPPYALQPKPEDIFTGSPPLGFTFGLGGLVLFPFYYGASTFLIEKPTPELLLQAIQDFNISICFTAPTAWRIITTKVKEYDISSLRKCVSAGETLPAKVWQDWYDATGLQIIDGIGSTEILHIFISNNQEFMKKGSTGKPVFGYEAKIIDKDGNEVPVNEPGRLAVRGITGCKYLNREEKQQEYVEKGWNITGDIYKKDEEGYFCFVARGDDMIISSGYNIGAVEVESVLLTHPDIAECAVVGCPDEERGMLVCAHIVLKDQGKAGDDMSKSIQDWFKENAAPYKYPRIIKFAETLPKTETGKIQRFKLK